MTIRLKIKLMEIKFKIKINQFKKYVYCEVSKVSGTNYPIMWSVCRLNILVCTWMNSYHIILVPIENHSKIK